MIKRNRISAVFVLAAMFAATGAYADVSDDEVKSLAAFSKEATSDPSYELQIGDRLRLKIFPEDQYIKGGDMQVSPDGNITLPLIGKVPVAGKSVLKAQRELAEIVDKDYIVDPEVVIEVLQFREQSIIILGQIKKPGTYSFPAGASELSLLQAVSLAGGFSEIANIKKIKIVRKAGGKNKIIRANAEAIISGDQEDVELEPDDVIHVSESLF